MQSSLIINMFFSSGTVIDVFYGNAINMLSFFGGDYALYDEITENNQAQHTDSTSWSKRWCAPKYYVLVLNERKFLF